VREQVGLPITVGGARTKSVAKVASAVAKPDGLLIVEPDREREFLHPLPVERLWGCGPVTTEKLHARGLTTVGQLAGMSKDDLGEIVGRAAGRHLHAMANGRDARRVRRTRGRGSFGSQSAFGRRPRSPEAHDATLVALVDRVTRRMRKAGRAGRTVTLRLRFSDYTRATRSHTLSEATASSEAILPTIRSLMRAAQPVIEERGGLTLLGVTVSGLDGDRPDEQLALPLDDAGRSAVDGLLDDVRDRFGTAAVTRASLVGRGPSLQTWLMPGEDPDDLA
jgi:DNA polymerase-4